MGDHEGSGKPDFWELSHKGAMGGHSRQRRRAAESTRAILGMEEREGRWRAGDEAARRGVRVWGQLTQDLVCWANGFYALSNEELFFSFQALTLILGRFLKNKIQVQSYGH